jgi:hypothetical protein
MPFAADLSAGAALVIAGLVILSTYLRKMEKGRTSP